MESTVIADITLLPSEISGKTSGYSSGVRPNHYFPQLETYAIGKITFLDNGNLKLGMTARARVQFLGWPALRDFLAPDVEWEIREAAKVVGRGKVLAIENKQS